MKAISLIQPWAILCALGVKTVETRSWGTKYRGPLLIHASGGSSMDTGELLELPAIKAYKATQKDGLLPIKMIIGRVHLRNVIKSTEFIAQYEELGYYTDLLRERQMGDLSPGRYAWLLDEPVLFENPIPFPGKLGLWEYTPDPTTNYFATINK